MTGMKAAMRAANEKVNALREEERKVSAELAALKDDSDFSDWDAASGALVPTPSTLN